MYTVEEVAERWSLNRKTVYEMVQKGRLPSRRFGRAVRIPRSVVESLESQGSVDREGE
jgi:excisionase family DNA binding protein